jgi:predicted lipid carrier protein YhbT
MSLTEDKVDSSIPLHWFVMNQRPPMPQIPAVVGVALWPVPLAFVELALGHLVRSIGSRHPSMFDRLGEHAGKRLVLEPTDLPFVLVITLDPAEPEVSVVRPPRRPRADARIAGPIAALLGLAHGRFDGDALFFSGDLAVEGDIEAILALRNALDDAELDLLHEGAAVLGPLSGPAEWVMRPAAPLVERHTGLALTRGHPSAP